MDRVSKTYPSQESKNNSRSYTSNRAGQRYYGDKNAYQEAQDREIRKRLDEQAKGIEELKRIVAELENRAKKAITVAPLKDELVYTQSPRPSIQRVDISELTRNVKPKKVIQSYTGSVRPRVPQIKNYESSRAPQISYPERPISLVTTEKKKTSLWERIKKAVKDFFVEPEDRVTKNYNQNWDKQDDYTRYKNYTRNNQYEQFRQSMTANVTYNPERRKIEEERKRIQNKGHILDRYI